MPFKPYEAPRFSAERAHSQVEARTRRPPWRQLVGRAFLALDSQLAEATGENLMHHDAMSPFADVSKPCPPSETPPSPPAPPSSPPPSPPDAPPPDDTPPPMPSSPVPVEDLKAAHAVIYLDIVRKTFAEFSDEPVGRLGYEGPDFDRRPLADRPITWEWDTEAVSSSYGLLPYETTIAFEAKQAQARTGKPCWNCGERGHVFSQCPEPLDRSAVAASRNARDASRSLELLDRFKPGHVSDELRHALFAREDDDGDVEMDDDFTPFPWLERMLKWGYPPGYITSRDPLLAVCERLMGVDTLQVIGGDLGEDVVEAFPPKRRWVDYNTDAFDSARLTAYRPERPLPLE